MTRNQRCDSAFRWTLYCATFTIFAGCSTGKYRPEMVVKTREVLMRQTPHRKPAAEMAATVDGGTGQSAPSSVRMATAAPKLRSLNAVELADGRICQIFNYAASFNNGTSNYLLVNTSHCDPRVRKKAFLEGIFIGALQKSASDDELGWIADSDLQDCSESRLTAYVQSLLYSDHGASLRAEFESGNLDKAVARLFEGLLGMYHFGNTDNQQMVTWLGWQVPRGQRFEYALRHYLSGFSVRAKSICEPMEEQSNSILQAIANPYVSERGDYVPSTRLTFPKEFISGGSLGANALENTGRLVLDLYNVGNQSPAQITISFRQGERRVIPDQTLTLQPQMAQALFIGRDLEDQFADPGVSAALQELDAHQFDMFVTSSQPILGFVSWGFDVGTFSSPQEALENQPIQKWRAMDELCPTQLSVDRVNLSSSNPSASVQIQIPAQCLWVFNQDEGSPWLQVTAQGSGTGPGQVEVRAAGPAEQFRRGTFYINGLAVAVEQEAGAQ